MFGMFNKKSKQPSPLSREVGLLGAAEAVYAASQINGNGGWSCKIELMKGCIDAFEQGRPANLRAFVMGYLEFKRAQGYVTKIETEGIDDGFVHLVCDPLMLLLEKQKDPQAVLATLTDEMSPYYKQVMLDLIIRRCAMTNSWMVAPIVLAAGADANTGRGRSLCNSAHRGYTKLTQILLEHGADIEQARALVDDENIPDFDKTIQAAKALIAASTAKPSSAIGHTQTLDAPRIDISPAGRTTIKKPPAPGSDQ